MCTRAEGYCLEPKNFLRICFQWASAIRLHRILPPLLRKLAFGNITVWYHIESYSALYCCAMCQSFNYCDCSHSKQQPESLHLEACVCNSSRVDTLNEALHTTRNLLTCVLMCISNACKIQEYITYWHEPLPLSIFCLIHLFIFNPEKPLITETSTSDALLSITP